MTSLGRNLLLSTVIAVVLLWAIALGSQSDPVLGVGMAHTVLKAAAIAATAVFAVMVAGKLILTLAMSMNGMEPTGFQRVIIYGLLTFAASFATLRYFGFDLSAVLTTSAIVTAAVGFAMQPTLSSMIAGLALHADRAVHVGDCILLDGEAVRIESMNWRAAIGRRNDGQLLVIPNAKLTEGSTQVLHASDAHRAEFSFFGPLDHPPQQICELVREIVSDLAPVDKSRAVSVAPVSFEPDKESMKFRIHYWTRSYLNRSMIEGEIARRIWYAFQRNRIAFPRPTACAISAGMRSGLDLAEEEPAQLKRQIERVSPAAAAQAEELAAKGRLLLYAPDERLIMPEWSDGWQYLLLRGSTFEVPEFDLTPELASRRKLFAVERLGPTAAITRVADELSLLIGPYAKLAVIRVGDRAETYEQLCREVALEIPDESARANFLRRVLTEDAAGWRPGAVIPARRNASGQLASEPSLRARGEVALLAVPVGLLEQFTARAAAAE
jgi:small-conductance mechanosensitive channel